MCAAQNVYFAAEPKHESINADEYLLFFPRYAQAHMAQCRMYPSAIMPCSCILLLLFSVRSSFFSFNIEFDKFMRHEKVKSRFCSPSISIAPIWKPPSASARLCGYLINSTDTNVFTKSGQCKRTQYPNTNYVQRGHMMCV